MKITWRCTPPWNRRHCRTARPVMIDDQNMEYEQQFLTLNLNFYVADANNLVLHHFYLITPFKIKIGFRPIVLIQIILTAILQKTLCSLSRWFVAKIYDCSWYDCDSFHQNVLDEKRCRWCQTVSQSNSTAPVIWRDVMTFLMTCFDFHIRCSFLLQLQRTVGEAMRRRKIFQDTGLSGYSKQDLFYFEENL